MNIGHSGRIAFGGVATEMGPATVELVVLDVVDAWAVALGVVEVDEEVGASPAPMVTVLPSAVVASVGLSAESGVDAWAVPKWTGGRWWPAAIARPEAAAMMAAPMATIVSHRALGRAPSLRFRRTRYRSAATGRTQVV